MRPLLRETLAVALGASIGTAARFTIDALLPHSDRGFPVSTLIVNVVGSLVLGLLVARVWPVASPALRAFLGAGLLGSFTTFSAVAVSLIGLGVSWLSALYLVLSMTLGLLAAWAGLRLGRRS